MFAIVGFRKMGEKTVKWLTSGEVRKALRISTCDLAHMREQGVVRAIKRGNAYLYLGEDVARARTSRSQSSRICRLDGSV